VAYVPFEGEQHGFRRAENIVRAIEAEYLFFAKIFDIEPADTIPPLEVENL
jgi:dipeptidyl aminopeptidase/acylaminoacyl peptidase